MGLWCPLVATGPIDLALRTVWAGSEKRPSGETQAPQGLLLGHGVISPFPEGRWTWCENTLTWLGTEHLLVLGPRTRAVLGPGCVRPRQGLRFGVKDEPECAGLMFVPLQPEAGWTAVQEGQWKAPRKPEKAHPLLKHVTSTQVLPILHVLWSFCTKSVLSDLTTDPHLLQSFATNTGCGLGFWGFF